MRASVRRSIQALLDGVDMVTMLAGAVSGAAVGYTYYPATLNADLRLAATGAVALGGTFLFTTVADAVLAPLRRRFAQADIADMRAAAQTRAAEARGVAVPIGLSEALDQVTAAAEDDAARRAAQAAYRIDLSDQLLSNPGRWRGYTNGEATYYLAPGAVLHYSREESERGIAEPLYTLLTADDPTPVPVTNVRDILDDLSLRARKTAEALDAVAPSTV
ncbi:hypothetical protein [Streptomyces venezuelae]|uniref:hypothetical protein n=1 Tax=Streptomyces venezuelae TaxID=54571 RepID=UPI000903698D|nr:hypothetical protein [Streptomyces venezuelae]APE26786.1 hypothetical protein vnz_37405 [Streptomyces venezuelae]